MLTGDPAAAKPRMRDVRVEGEVRRRARLLVKMTTDQENFYASTRITKVSGNTPSYAIASAAALDFIAAMIAPMSGTSMSTATRVGFCGSTNVRMMVMPRGPTNSLRLGEASQCALSLMVWCATMVA